MLNWFGACWFCWVKSPVVEDQRLEPPESRTIWSIDLSAPQFVTKHSTFGGFYKRGLLPILGNDHLKSINAWRNACWIAISGSSQYLSRIARAARQSWQANWWWLDYAWLTKKETDWNEKVGKHSPCRIFAQIFWPPNGLEDMFFMVFYVFLRNCNQVSLVSQVFSSLSNTKHIHCALSWVCLFCR